MADTRKTWSSRIGFVLASAGAAVGLGAIWKFPYMVGTNGGSAFVFPYILMTFTVGLVLLIAEVALGRVGRGGIVTAYRNLGGKAWVPAGYLGVLTGFLVLCFYSAIGGWTLSYFCDALTGTTVVPDQAALGEHFGRLTADPVTAMGFQWLFLLLNGLILALDVTKGIERVSKLLMPLLFILMLVLIGRGLTLPGAWDGVEYLFAFRPEAFSWDAMLQAMGFTFFSLCVGCGCMLTYGSYLDEDSNLLTGCSWIAFLGVIASLLGGLMIMPAVFAFGLDPTAGPGLTFITMPADPLGPVLRDPLLSLHSRCRHHLFRFDDGDHGRLPRRRTPLHASRRGGALDGASRRRRRAARALLRRTRRRKVLRQDLLRPL